MRNPSIDNIQRVERHEDYEYLVNNGLLDVSQMLDMTDEQIHTFADIERYEEKLDAFGDDLDNFHF